MDEEIEELDLFVWSDEDLAKPPAQSPQFDYLKSIGNNFTKIKEKDKKSNTELQALQQENTVLKQTVDDMIEKSLNKETEADTSLIIKDSDNFYGKLSVYGGQRQEKREGYNKLNYTNTEFTPSAQSWYYLNGKSGAYGSTIASDTNLKVAIEKGKEYTFYYKEKSNIKTLQLVYDNEEIAVNNIEQNYAMFTANKDGFIVPRMLNLETNKVTYIKDVMIYEGTETKPYEPYGVMPSLSYPSEIEAVGDNINLFDKDTMPLTQGLWINTTGLATNRRGWYVIVPIVGGQSITISRKVKDTFYVTTTTDYPANGIAVVDSWKTATNTDVYTINTSKEAKYLFLGLAAADSLTDEQRANAIDKLKVEKGSKATAYSSFGQGSVEITTSNKNVLDIPTNAHVQMNGATVDTDNNGTITINGTFNANTYLRLYDNKKSLSAPGVWNKKRLIKGNWVFSSKIISNSINETAAVSAYIRNETVGANIVDYAMLYRVLGAKEKQQKFTLEENTDTVIYLWIAKDTTFDNVKLQFQLEPDELTDYIEHQGETLIMPIQQKMYEGDDFEKIDGVWYEKHNWEIRTFDGTEVIEYATNDKSFYVQENKFKRFSDYTNKILCNCYDSKTNLSNRKYGVLGYSRSGFPGQNWIYFTDENYATVDEFKTMLAQKYVEGNPLYVIYTLAEPLLLKCTDEQSAILDKIDTYRDGTIITTDNDLCKIKLRYKQSLEATIKEYTATTVAESE